MRKSRRASVDGDQACLFLSRTANFESSCDLILELLHLQGNFFERSFLMFGKDLRKGQKSPVSQEDGDSENDISN